jgi:hypothetical protein
MTGLHISQCEFHTFEKVGLLEIASTQFARIHSGRREDHRRDMVTPPPPA